MEEKKEWSYEFFIDNTSEKEPLILFSLEMGGKIEEDIATSMLDSVKRVEFLLLTSSTSWPYSHF